MSLPLLGPVRTDVELDRHFWEAAQERRLVVQRCARCSRTRLPGVRTCDCGSKELEWVAASGRGRIVSFCIFHRSYFEESAGALPYGVAVVRLEEGTLLYSNIDPSGAPPAVGLEVVCVFEDVGEGRAIPRFRVADSGGHR